MKKEKWGFWEKNNTYVKIHIFWILTPSWAQICQPRSQTIISTPSADRNVRMISTAAKSDHCFGKPLYSRHNRFTPPIINICSVCKKHVACAIAKSWQQFILCDYNGKYSLHVSHTIGTRIISRIYFRVTYTHSSIVRLTSPQQYKQVLLLERCGQLLEQCRRSTL